MDLPTLCLSKGNLLYARRGDGDVLVAGTDVRLDMVGFLFNGSRHALYADLMKRAPAMLYLLRLVREQIQDKQPIRPKSPLAIGIRCTLIHFDDVGFVPDEGRLEVSNQTILYLARDDGDVVVQEAERPVDQVLMLCLGSNFLYYRELLQNAPMLLGLLREVRDKIHPRKPIGSRMSITKRINAILAHFDDLIYDQPVSEEE